MRHRDEVFSNLNHEQIVSTLEACSLTDKQEFTEDEATRIEHCRQLVEQGKSYKQVTAYFRRQDKSKQVAPQDDSETTLLDISELLVMASEQSKTRISFKEVALILDTCGLPDKDQYTSEEGERFLEACDLIKNQNKSYEEVAILFGDQHSGETNMNSHLATAASDIDTAAANIANDLARSKAAEAASLVIPAFKYHFAREISSQKIRQEFEAFGKQLQAELGKGEARMMRVMMEINSAQSLQQKPAALPEASSNGSTHE